MFIIMQKYFYDTCMPLQLCLHGCAMIRHFIRLNVLFMYGLYAEEKLVTCTQMFKYLSV